MPRGKLDIDPEQIVKYASIQCTLREMAALVGCNEKTLRNRFSAEIDKGREHGKASLRRMQWKAAEKGSHTMLIWLGKQYLGQTDKQDLQHTSPDGSLSPTATQDAVLKVLEAKHETPPDS